MRPGGGGAFCGVWDRWLGALPEHFRSPVPLHPLPPPACAAAGHLDGTLCLWDTRQSRAGSQPLAQVQDQAQAVLCISNTASDSQVLTLAARLV